MIIFFNTEKLTTSLALLRAQVMENPAKFSSAYVRQEYARRVIAALSIKRNWYGPVVCEGCQFYHGQQGIICALHPSGPDGTYCADWEGPPKGGFAYVADQGWTYQEYVIGQGLVVRRDHILETEVGVFDLLEEFPWPMVKSASI